MANQQTNLQIGLEHACQDQNNGRNLTVKQRTAAMKRDNYGLLTKEKQKYSILRGDPPQTLRNKMDTDLTKHEAGEIFIKWGPTHPADNWSLYSLQGEEMAAVKEAASEALPDQVPEENIDSKLLKASASDGLEMYLEIICLEIICLEIICLEIICLVLSVWTLCV